LEIRDSNIFEGEQPAREESVVNSLNIEAFVLQDVSDAKGELENGIRKFITSACR